MAELDKRVLAAFHEAGHAALVYWRGDSLRDCRLAVNKKRFGGYIQGSRNDHSEHGLMVSLGGPVAELIAQGVFPAVAIRVRGDYKNPDTDSSQIRWCLRFLRGKDDRKYQIEVQNKVLVILCHPNMAAAMLRITQSLARDGEISGEECERIFAECGAPRWDHTGERGDPTGLSGV